MPIKFLNDSFIPALQVGPGGATYALAVDGAISTDQYIAFLSSGVNSSPDMTIGVTSNVMTFSDVSGGGKAIFNVDNVGIGTTSPGKTLDVNGNVNIDGTLYVNANNNHIRLIDADSTGNFSVGVNTNFQIRDVAANTTPLTISAGTPGNTIFTTDSGRVGIGLSNPGTALHVNGFTRINGGLQMNTANASIYQIQDSALKFGTNNTERMRIDSLGNVQFNSYGSGGITGTTAYNLAVDSSGNIIENSANTRSVFVATSTDTTTNINATTTIQWNSEDIKDSGYTHSDGTNPEQITITQAGTYKIYAAITYTTTVQRANVALQILVNNVATGARGAGGYVRSNSGHNDGTTIVEDYVTVNANDVIKIQTSQEAVSGTVTLRSGESKIIIEKLTGLTLSTTDANTLGGLGAADFVQSDSFPAGNNTEIQFNNNGQLGASSNFTFDGTNLTVGDVLINKTDSTSGVLTINTNRSFGREFTITNNGQTPLISADNTLTLEAQAGESQIVLTGGGSDDRVQIGKNGTYPFYFGVGGTNTGRLGIGTTSPSEKLNVDGNILATGTVLGSNLSGTNTGDQVLPTDFVSAANGGTFNGDLTVNADFFVTGSAFEISTGVVTDFGGNTLSNIGTPLSGNDATTKTYVDNALASKLSTTGKAADSNLLDGINSTSFLRSDTNDSFTGNELHFPTLDLSISNNNSPNQGNTYFRGDGTHFVLGLNSGNTLYLNYGNSAGTFRAYGNGMHWNDVNIGTPWGSSNDGSGSGLDADLLDGKHATDFVAVTGDTMTGTLNINKSGSSQIAVNNRAYFGTHYTSTDVWIYGGPGDNIYLGGGIGNIQNDVYVGNGDLIVSNGDVGIGETSPDAKLDVNGAGNFDGGTVESGVDTHTDVGISIAKGKFIKSNDGNYLRNLIGQTTSGVIEIGQTGTSLISDIRLKPGTSGNIIFQGSGSEDMRINSSGNVGIGTTSPGVKLDVNGRFRVQDNGDISLDVNTNGAFQIGDVAEVGGGAFIAGDNTDIDIVADGGPIVTFKNNGRVGIGTTGPGAMLDVDGSFKLSDFASISVATTGSLSPNQNYQASTQDTLADLTVDPSGNVVRGMQEGTWTFTKAQLDGNLGMTLIAAPGTNKAVIVYESSWMIKYNSTGAISANQKYEIRQASNTGIGIITVLPGAKINEILSNGQTMPGGGASAYGFYSRDVPADAGGRTFKTNTATTLHKNVSNQLPGGVQTVSIKLRYRIYDATTF